MKYRVMMHSKPSPGSEFYRGYVDVEAEDCEAAKQEAIRRLATGTFRDRGFDAWVVEEVRTRRR